MHLSCETDGDKGTLTLHPAAVRCDMVSHQAFRARRVRTTGIGGEVRHGVTSGASCETSLSKHKCLASTGSTATSATAAAAATMSVALMLIMSQR